MLVKRSGRTILGAQFSKKEQQAIDIEINKQLVAAERQIQDDTDAMVLYVAMKMFELGPKRMKQFYDELVKAHEELIRHYEMPEDNPWLVRHLLKQKGVDIDEWSKEWKEKLDREHID